MSYQKKSIKAVIKDIDESKIYLPALQRKFVWGKKQIELLFDSLMRNYPFGTFLFWRLPRESAENYVFYDFLKEYDERTPYNRRKTGAFLSDEIIGILDGQQRLSSLYIGLMGTHTEKAPHKRTTNQSAYEKMSLYLNLLSLPYELNDDDEIIGIEDKNFEFRFLTDAAASTSVSRRIEGQEGDQVYNEPMYWMKVGQVLSWKSDPEFDKIVDGFQSSALTEDQRNCFDEMRRFIKRGLDTLHTRIHRDELINYFEVAKDDLEDILKIFVRVNSGGTVLSKNDLLFSTIVATWDSGRDQIEELLKRINSKGDGFNFGTEYLMRCCLVLTDGPVIYKVNSFKSENVTKIRAEWPQIAKAIETTVDILSEFGFSGSTLTSQNATLILAYYIQKGGDLSKESKQGMRKYLIHALLNGIYGSAQEQVISEFRNGFRTEIQDGQSGTKYVGRFKNFSFEEVLKIRLPQQKSLQVTDRDIERFLELKKGSASFWILSLLYPHLRLQDVTFHQDHIHPAANFTESNFDYLGIPKDQWHHWLDCRDALPNLQLMEGTQNSAKNAKPFRLWFEEQTKTYQASFMPVNYLPPDESLEFENFIKFFNARKELLRAELTKVLAVTKEEKSDLEIWAGRDDELEDDENYDTRDLGSPLGIQISDPDTGRLVYSGLWDQEAIDSHEEQRIRESVEAQKAARNEK